VRTGHVDALLPRAAHPGADRTLARTPAEHQQLRLRTTVDGERGHLSRDPRYLGGPQLGHASVVGGVVGDVARVGFLLESADPMLETGRSWYGPGTREALVACVGQKRVIALWCCKGRVDLGQLPHLRNPPGLR